MKMQFFTLSHLYISAHSNLFQVLSIPVDVYHQSKKQKNNPLPQPTMSIVIADILCKIWNHKNIKFASIETFTVKTDSSLSDWVMCHF